MINALKNHMRLEAQRILGDQAKTRVGIVDGYDPSHYSVKVRISRKMSYGLAPVNFAVGR